MVRNKQGRYGYVDHSGIEVIPCAYNAVKWFTEGRSAVMNEKEKWGFIDENGNLVIVYHYDEVEQFQGGLALCTVEGKKTHIDKDGNELLNFEV